MSRTPRRQGNVAKGRPPAQASAASVEVGFAQDWNIALQRGNLVPGTSATQMMRDLATMAESDETVGAILWCISAMVSQIAWKHEPQVDGKKSLEDPEARKYADFADSLMLDMDHSWGDHVDDAMNMVWAGFAPIEMVTKQRTAKFSRFTDGFYGFKRLSLRDPTTIWGWLYDDTHQNVLGARQMTYWGSATIPMWKTLHYRTTMSPEKPMGKSLLRSAHRAWVLKNRIQDTEAIGIERELVGLPLVRVPMEDLETANETDSNGAPTPTALAARSRIQAAITAATQMRFNKSGGLSASARQAMPRKDFALPGKGDGPKGAGAGSYPIPDASHARDALSRVSANGTPAEKAEVRAAAEQGLQELVVAQAS